MITIDFMDLSINGFLSHGSSPMTGCFRHVQWLDVLDMFYNDVIMEKHDLSITILYI